MKIPRVIIIFLLGFFFSQLVLAQDSSMQNISDPELELRDTTIVKDPAFIVRNNYAVRDSLNAFKLWASKMHDTTIAVDPSFNVINVYAESDSLANLYGGFASRRDSLVHAFRDSLSAIGRALLRTAEMQDTTIVVDPAFVVQDIYVNRDRQDAAKDSLKALMNLASTMQDTMIVLDPDFKVIERYTNLDQYNAFHDSVWAALAQSAVMQDTVVMIDPAFFVRNVYEKKDKLDAERDSIMWPTIMRDTIINIDSSFIVKDLYPRKDYMDSVREFQNAYADSVYSDSVNRHWAGWRKYEVQPDHAYTLNSQKILKGGSKNSLKYNIADFYLFLNGDPVKPDNAEYNFFAAACLAFRYDDTLLLNSGLGFKVGVGVGIKIIDGKFTSSLHANKRNEEIYKESGDDTVYKRSIIVEPSSQSLTLQYDPSSLSNEIITGEYQATYKKFYQKNENGQIQALHYSVRIVFRCRVTGGLDTIKSLR